MELSPNDETYIGIGVILLVFILIILCRRCGKAKNSPFSPLSPNPEIGRVYPYYQANATPDEFEDNPLLSDADSDEEDGKGPGKPILTVEEYVQCVDKYIRHRDDFYAPGYIYNIDRLRNEMPPPKGLRINKSRADFMAFLRSRKEFRILPGSKSFELTNLTPFREEGVPVYGYFHCVVNYCNSRWESAETFCDRFQTCWKCGAKVYPFVQSTTTASPTKKPALKHTQSAGKVGFGNLTSPSSLSTPRNKAHGMSRTKLTFADSPAPASEPTDSAAPKGGEEKV